MKPVQHGLNSSTYTSGRRQYGWHCFNNEPSTYQWPIHDILRRATGRDGGKVDARRRDSFVRWQGNGIGTIRVDRGSFLKNIDMFDNVEFGVSHRDAKAMSPATKMLLEQCFLALLDSGIDYRTKNIGCYTSGTSIELTNVSEPVRQCSLNEFSEQLLILYPGRIRCKGVLRTPAIHDRQSNFSPLGSSWALNPR